MKFVALDFETSGLDSKRHAPVSLGVAVFEGGDVIASAEWTLAPPVDKNGRVSREYDVCALQVSGKTWKEIQAGVKCEAVCFALGKFAREHGVSDAAVVAFNAPFDLSFYSELLYLGGSWNQHFRRFETFKPPLIGPWQCARLMAVSQLDLERYDLDTTARHFGLSRSGETHGALEDAILAGRIYQSLTTPTHSEAVA